MMRKKLHAHRAVRSPEPTLSRQPRPSWRTSALALAAVFTLGLPLQDAHALALGRVTVHSALGQPLRAEIDIPQISPDEVTSLRTTLASPEAFRAAGMERSAPLAELQITLQRRANGDYFLRLSTERVIADPFVDLILEASWSSGRIVRDYTMLFDPPPASRPALPPPIAAQVPPMAPAAPATPAGAAPAPAPAPTTAAAPSPAPVAAAGPAPAARPQPAPLTRPQPAPAQRLTVQAGQTAGRLAAAHKPPTVSLDQMLVALLRANPEAFVGGNINRLKAGAVLDLPTDAQASAVKPAEARQILVAQSRDFGEFRRRLAEGVGASPLASSTPGRQASGRLDAQVQDKRTAEAAPDKLTLSKGSVDSRTAADKAASERVALERAAQDTAARRAELNKNIAELNRLNAASTSAGPAPAAAAATPGASAAPAPILAVPRVAQAASAASAAAAVASAATEAAPVASAPASAPKPAAAKPAPAPKAAPEPGLADFLFDNPMIPAAGGGIVALLTGLVLVRLRQRRKATGQVDSSFLESRLQPDSFFGASGGQRIDTAEDTGVAGTSMVYSPSQIDAAGDVDPVAEADVYLAYGRDLQAEEILKEALRTNPQRVAIHVKLLEIYAKRRDLPAFETLARDAQVLTHGHGPEWAHIGALGQEIDPDNLLYRPVDDPVSTTGSGSGFPSTSAPALVVSGATAVAMASQPQPKPEGPPALRPVSPDEAAEREALDAAAQGPLDLDLSAFDAASALAPVPALAPAPARPNAALSPFALSELAPEEPMPAHDPDAFTQAAALPPLPPTVTGPLADELPAALPPIPPLEAHAAPSMPQALMDLDLDIPSFTPHSDTPKPAMPAELTLDAAAFDVNLSATGAAHAAHPVAGGMIDFDLSGISLDLETPNDRATRASEPSAPAPAPTPVPVPAPTPADFNTDFTTDLPSDLPGASLEVDPLATKLALAEEFNAIGDTDGARSLAEEVRSEAFGDLRERAERLLAELG